jgi:hypothetical protein
LPDPGIIVALFWAKQQWWVFSCIVLFEYEFTESSLRLGRDTHL